MRWNWPSIARGKPEYEQQKLNASDTNLSPRLARPVPRCTCPSATLSHALIIYCNLHTICCDYYYRRNVYIPVPFSQCEITIHNKRQNMHYPLISIAISINFENFSFQFKMYKIKTSKLWFPLVRDPDSSVAKRIARSRNIIMKASSEIISYIWSNFSGCSFFLW